MKTPSRKSQDLASFARHAAQAVTCHGVQTIPEPTPELIQKIHSLSGNTADLENILDALTDRLQPIVRPLPGTECTDTCGASPPQAALSNDVEYVANRLSYLRNRISSLMDSLAI